MMGKRPRHYALELIKAEDDASKKSIYQEIPEDYKKLVLAHYNSFLAKTK